MSGRRERSLGDGSCQEPFEGPTGSLERPILGLFTGPPVKALLEKLKPLQRHDIYSKLNELLF